MVRHFSQLVIARAPGLLPMLYTPRELEDELGIPTLTIRMWIKQGLPHERDERGHLWVNGIVFAGWVEQVHATFKTHKLATDEAFCFKCRQPVKMNHPRTVFKGRLQVAQAQCPSCGTSIHRGV